MGQRVRHGAVPAQHARRAAPGVRLAVRLRYCSAWRHAYPANRARTWSVVTDVDEVMAVKGADCEAVPMSAAVTESVYMLPDGRELARPQQAGLVCSSILTAALVHDHMPRMRLAPLPRSMTTF